MKLAWDSTFPPEELDADKWILRGRFESDMVNVGGDDDSQIVASS